jgi:hypothetical protein
VDELMVFLGGYGAVCCGELCEEFLAAQLRLVCFFYLLFVVVAVLTAHQIACVCELLAAAYMWDPPGSSFHVKIFLSMDQLSWLGIILSCTLFFDVAKC